jgi:hypothetical protein
MSEIEATESVSIDNNGSSVDCEATSDSDSNEDNQFRPGIFF